MKAKHGLLAMVLVMASAALASARTNGEDAVALAAPVDVEARFPLPAASTDAAVEMVSLAQTTPMRFDIDPPIDNWRLAWDFDRAAVPLHHFEVKVDDGAWAETVPTELAPNYYRAAVPPMTPGLHTVFVRACSNLKCGPDASVIVALEIVIPPVRNLRLERGEE